MKWNIDTGAKNKLALELSLASDPNVPVFVTDYLCAAMHSLNDVPGHILVIRSSGLIEAGEIRSTTEIKWLPVVLDKP